MGLLLTSNKHTTLLKSATGTGKSLILGILSMFIFNKTGKKVIVLVPTEFLQAYQTEYYCLDACRIP